MSFFITSAVGHSFGVSTTGTSTSADGTTVEGYSAEADISSGSSSSSDASGMAIAMGGDATAIGTDTLAIAQVAAVLSGNDHVQVASGTMDLLAVGEGEAAYATATSYAGLTGNADRVVTLGIGVTNFVQAPDSSAWYASSHSTLFALNIDDAYFAGESIGETIPISDGEAEILPELESVAPPAPANEPDDPCGCSEPDPVFTIDGNLAWFEVDVVAFSEDSYANADVSALAVEDQLSSVVVTIALAIE